MKKLALLPIMLLISASMVMGAFAESKFEHKQEVKKSQSTAPANEKTTKFQHKEATRKSQQ